MSSLLSISEFCGVVAEWFQIDRELVVPDARLVEELDLDSLEIFEFMLALDELSADDAPLGDLENLRSIADVHGAYLGLRS